MNELIFLTQVILISCSTLGALYLGKEALISLICLQCVLANVFVLKEITLCGLTATGSDAFTVGIVLGLNLLQEYYGRDSARKTIWLSFALLIFYILVSTIHLYYIPAATDIMQAHYAALFGHMPRIMLASLFVYLIVQLFDTALFARLNQWFSGRYLVLRVIISLSISQFLDTVLFSYLGLYGIISNITHIIIVSYTIKLTSILLSSPFVALTKMFKKPV
ncbi:MAG: queuosine precursor transporter [Candidatus Babeliales bacterium]